MKCWAIQTGDASMTSPGSEMSKPGLIKNNKHATPEPSKHAENGSAKNGIAKNENRRGENENRQHSGSAKNENRQHSGSA